MRKIIVTLNEFIHVKYLELLLAWCLPGILLLLECPGRLESLMTVTSLLIDVGGNTPFHKGQWNTQT